MPPQETEVLVRLLAGEPPRIRIAKMPHGDLQAILVPRGKLSQAVRHHEWNRLAVYLLLGKPEEDAAPTLYVGRTDTAWERIRNHDYRKEFWDTAIVILSKTDDGFSHDDIHWLEWRCTQKAKEIDQFKLCNDHEPDEPRSTKPDMCELFDSLCLLVSVLGYADVFDPAEVDSAPENGTPFPPPPGEFYCRGKDANATGALVADGFVVRKDSIARLHVAPHAVETVGRKRKELLDEGVLVKDEGGMLRFTRDHLFRSPSGAAAVVLGRSADGPIEWENKDGKSLDEIK